MPYKDVYEMKLTAYTPAYVKKALKRYVRHHKHITMSKFIKDAISEKLAAVGELPQHRQQ